MGFAGDERGSEARLSIPITFITSPLTHVLKHNHLVSFTISFRKEAYRMKARTCSCMCLIKSVARED